MLVVLKHIQATPTLKQTRNLTMRLTGMNMNENQNENSQLFANTITIVLQRSRYGRGFFFGMDYSEFDPFAQSCDIW